MASDNQRWVYVQERTIPSSESNLRIDESLINDIGELIIGSYWYPDERYYENNTKRWPALDDVIAANGAGARVLDLDPTAIITEGQFESGLAIKDANGNSVGRLFNARIGGVMTFQDATVLQPPSDPNKPLDINQRLHDAARSALMLPSTPTSSHRLPPLIMWDQEGGVTGLEIFRTNFPSERRLGALPAQEIVETVRVASSVLALGGMTLNLAPLGDVVAPGDFLGSRGFGNDPTVIEKGVVSFVEGSRLGGVPACPKHAPGHNTPCDSHKKAPLIRGTKPTGEENEAQLYNEYLKPFREAKADIYLVGHLFYPEFFRQAYGTGNDYDTNAYRLTTQSPLAFERLVVGKLGPNNTQLPGITEGIAFDDDHRPLMITDDLDAMISVHNIYGTPSSSEAHLDLPIGMTCYETPSSTKSLDDVVKYVFESRFDLILCQYTWPEVFLALVRWVTEYVPPANSPDDHVNPRQDWVQRAAARVRAFKLRHLEFYKKPVDFQREKESRWPEKGTRTGTILDKDRPIIGATSSQIDYRRIATLPVLLGPATVANNLAAFVSPDLGAGPVQRITWSAEALDADPATPVATPPASEWQGFLLARSRQALFASLDDGAINDVQPSLVPTSQPPSDGTYPGSGYDPFQRDALIWDATSSPLPVPLVPKNSAVFRWLDETLVSGLIDADIPAADGTVPMYDPSTGYKNALHILASQAATGDGELDPRWLRAPIPGVARFEHYEHQLEVQGGWEPGPRSNVGRIVIRGAEPSLLLRRIFSRVELAFPPTSRVVFEHVDAATAQQALEGLLVHQLHHFREIIDVELESTKDRGGYSNRLAESMTWLLRSWEAWLRVSGTVSSPNVPAVTSLTPNSTSDEVDTAIGAMLSAHVAHLARFLDVYVPKLMGRPWRDLELTLLTPQDRASSPLEDAYNLLDEVHITAEARDVVVFAGCPVGHAGRHWTVSGGRGEASTFDAEVLALRELRDGTNGRAARDPRELRNSGELPPMDPAVVTGPAALVSTMRVLDPLGRDTISWLRDVAGGNLTLGTIPLFASNTYRIAGHPIREAWEDDGVTPVA